jgi:CrcB protein
VIPKRKVSLREGNLRDLLFLAVAGALGTLCRYGLSTLAQRITWTGFPFGTLLVNVLGSIFIGFIMQVGLNTDLIPRSLRLILTIGFLGAFTTFSTFTYETVRYLDDGAWLIGTLNIMANIGLCVFGTVLGMFIGRVTYGGA